ncbi:MAG: SIMPL domain-containing protein [Actinomycetota bacterium]|nr:SIMPL domain-containing protein [Actinomycetota bacterium]
MQQQSRPWGRAALALGAALVVLAIGASLGKPSALAGNRTIVPAAQTIEAPGSIGQATVDRSVMAPVSWCCSGTSPSGVTVTGQATVKGQGREARDSAITQAVADATDQAETAAKAAGLTLGEIVDLQVSSSGYPYPLMAADSSGAEGSVGASGTIKCQPGGCPESGGGIACPGVAECAPTGIVCADCPTTIAPPAETFASVTITWAIG